MTEKRQPWMKWYARDWRGDGALRMCSFAARGLWSDLLSLIHDEGVPYGYLLINGKQPASAHIARMLGGSTREIDGLLAELEGAGVFSRDAQGTIYSRRMIRDKAKAERDRENGKGGGNPRLRETDNGGVNPQVKAQIPEARSQEDSVANATDAPASENSILDLKRELWKRAKAFLGQHGISEQKAGALVGKWLKACGPPDAETRLLHILASAETHCQGDIVEYVTAAIQRGTGTRKTPAQERNDGIRSVFAENHFAAHGVGPEPDRPGDQDFLPASGRRDLA